MIIRNFLMMKTPKSKRALETYRSASDQQFPTMKPLLGKPFLLKFSVKAQNSEDIKSKLNNHKSEVIINKNLIGSEEPELVDSSSDCQLIPTPKTPQHPKEMLQKSLIKLKSIHRNDSVIALRDIIQISRFNPQLLMKSMPDVYKGITVMLKSLRVTAARTACQAANELFMNMPYNEAPEFDELIYVLLQKTADTNKHLQKDAMEALDSMIIHVPPEQSIRILLHRRIAGYNLNVRTKASKLLACVLSNFDSCSITALSEDTKIRLIHKAIRFLEDNTYDIKFHGMRLVTTLMQHKDFEKIFRTKINSDMFNQIKNILENAKIQLGIQISKSTRNIGAKIS